MPSGLATRLSHGSIHTEGNAMGIERGIERERAGWDVSIERGPDWLFLRLQGGGAIGGGPVLADRLLSMIREHHAHRVVLELDQVNGMDDSLLGALTRVGSRIRDDGGLVRVCGLSTSDLERLKTAGCADALPHFESRCAAAGPRCGGLP